LLRLVDMLPAIGGFALRLAEICSNLHRRYTGQKVYPKNNFIIKQPGTSTNLNKSL